MSGSIAQEPGPGKCLPGDTLSPEFITEAEATTFVPRQLFVVDAQSGQKAKQGAAELAPLAGGALGRPVPSCLVYQDRLALLIRWFRTHRSG